MKLLILGTGNMAHTHADAFKAIKGVTLAACADMDLKAAQKFAKSHDIPEAYKSLDEAIEAGGFDAAANVTPDAIHYETTLKLLSNGIHVFCEKPLATNYGHAAAMMDAAKGKGLVNGVNLTYRNVSALQKAHQLVRSGQIGELRHFEASYLQSWLTQSSWGDWASDPTWLWRLSTEHGSKGVLGDVGIHIVDFVTFAAGSDVSTLTCQLKTFEKAAGNQIGTYKLDANDSFSMTAELANGANGVIHASRFASGHVNDLTLKLFGTKGGLEVTNQGDRGTLRISRGEDLLNGTWVDMELGPVESTYESFANALSGDGDATPDFATATSLQAVIDSAIMSDKAGGKIALK